MYKAVATDKSTVFSQIIAFIKAENLGIGDKLPSIRTFAESLGVNGSLVRDGFVQLQGMGLIRILPRSGAVVESLDFSKTIDSFAGTLDASFQRKDPNLMHLIDARELLEVECSLEAARRMRSADLFLLKEALAETIATAKVLNENSSEVERLLHYEADIRFHLLINDLGGNPVLGTMLRTVLELLKPHLSQTTWSDERVDLTINAHLEIFEALKTRNADKVKKCMKEHMDHARDSLLKQKFEH
jgi:GntR family transcriptional repressor for pyruvate dehydrogenase complex